MLPYQAHTHTYTHPHTNTRTPKTVTLFCWMTDCLTAWSFARLNGWLAGWLAALLDGFPWVVNSAYYEHTYIHAYVLVCITITTTTSLWSHANVNKNCEFYKFAIKFNESRVLSPLFLFQYSGHLWIVCLSLYPGTQGDLCETKRCSVKLLDGIFTSLRICTYVCMYVFMTYKKLFMFQIVEAWVVHLLLCTYICMYVSMYVGEDWRK